MLGGSVITEWNDEQLLKNANTVCAELCESNAKVVLQRAKTILTTNAEHPTGKLAREIDIRGVHQKKPTEQISIVIAQGPRNYTRYYALHVEVGTSRSKAVPYLRPALHGYKSKIFRTFSEANKRLL